MKKLERQVILCAAAALACLAVSAATVAAVRVQADAAGFWAAAAEEPANETPVLCAAPSLTLPAQTAAEEQSEACLEDTPEPACVYDAVPVSFSDKELLAGTVRNEAGGEPFDGQVAVVQVALNRCLHPAFPGTVREVLCAPCQFVEGTTYSREHMDAVEAALAGYDALDGRTDVVFFSTGCLPYGSHYKWICCHEFRTYQ